MRISDWSSDACSSDLLLVEDALDHLAGARAARARHQLEFHGHVHDRLVDRELRQRQELRMVVCQRLGQGGALVANLQRSEEHTSELQSLMRISYAVFCLKKKKTINNSAPEYCHHVRPYDMNTRSY